MDFSKFDQQINKEELKKDIQEAEQNGGNYEEVPVGTYVGKFDKLEVATTKDGRPMLKAQFRITEGDFSKHCLFMNRVLFGTKNDAGMIASAIGFLKNLDAADEDGVPIVVDFESYNQFSELVLDIAESIDADQLEYEIEYDPEAFNSISINEVFG